MTGNNTIKPNQQRCRNISGDPSGHKPVICEWMQTGKIFTSSVKFSLMKQCRAKVFGGPRRV
ncbi:hypothetical protein YC2023_121557 [Brassica napus]